MRKGRRPPPEPDWLTLPLTWGISKRVAVWGWRLLPKIICHPEAAEPSRNAKASNEGPMHSCPHHYSKPHKHRLRLQPDSPQIHHPFLDHFLEGHHFTRRRLAPVHNRQRMLARNAHPPEPEPLAET